MIILCDFLLTILLLRVFYYIANRFKIFLDLPNSRSSHKKTAIRGGGFIFALVWIISGLNIALKDTTSPIFSIYIGTALLSLMGLYDDLKGIPIMIRLIVQCVVACLLISSITQYNIICISNNLVVTLGILGALLFIVAIIWSINLFNFMDGIDGLAVMEGIFFFGTAIIIFKNKEAEVLVYLSLMLVVLLLSFLIFNYPTSKYKLFMGDSGSTFLGFLIVSFAIIAHEFYKIPLLIWATIYGLFIFDATITLLRRIGSTPKWYLSHKMHAYQRLHQAGWSHRKILFGAILLNCILSGLAIGAYFIRKYDYMFYFMALLILSFIYIKIEYISPFYNSLGYMGKPLANN